MKGLILAVVSTFLTVSVAGTVRADSTSLPMVGSQWAVYEEVTLPNGNLHFYPAAHATTISAGGVEFAMPNASGFSPAYVNYLLDTSNVSLTESNVLSATINVETSAINTAFEGNPNGGCPGVSPTTCPGAVRLFFQSNLPASGGSICTGNGTNQNNYWWSNPLPFYTFKPGPSGNVVLTASLDPANWSNLCGQTGSSDQAGFDAALAKIMTSDCPSAADFSSPTGWALMEPPETATHSAASYAIN
jgi:hypothetical protein